jgi:hypothetical protein
VTAADQPTPRVGDTITTAAGLDALPVHSVLAVEGGAVAVCDQTFPRLPGESFWRVTSHGRRERSPYLLGISHQWTILYLPGAPQPAPTADAVERAARAAVDAVARLGVDADPEHDGDPWWSGYRQAQRECIADLAHLGDALSAALAAARAGYTEPPCYCGKRRDEPSPGCVYHQARAAQRDGEAVDREAERDALRTAITDGYWQQTGYRVTWEHIGPLMDAILAAGFTLTARGDAAPTVSGGAS